MKADEPQPERDTRPNDDYLYNAAGPEGMLLLAVVVVLILGWAFYALQSASTLHLSFPEMPLHTAPTTPELPEADASDAALYRAGNAALYGRGVPQSDARALELYQRCAAHGNADCEYSVAYMVSEGRGTAQDLRQAFEWLQRAAMQGHALAQDNLGVAYGDGRGVAQDWVQCYRWIDLAAKQGNAQAIKDLDYARARMTPAQIEQAKTLSAAWRPSNGRM